MKKHELVHKGERPYQCAKCDKTYSKQSQLKIHETIHTGEKPFHCEICKISFSRSKSLKRHNHRKHPQ